MPLHTIQTRPDAPPKRSQIDHAMFNLETEISQQPPDLGAPPIDHDLAADVVARLLDTGERVRADLAEGRIANLASFLVDAAALTRLTDWWLVDDLEEIVGRLWMVAR